MPFDGVVTDVSGSYRFAPPFDDEEFKAAILEPGVDTFVRGLKACPAIDGWLPDVVNAPGAKKTSVDSVTEKKVIWFFSIDNNIYTGVLSPRLGRLTGTGGIEFLINFYCFAGKHPNGEAEDWTALVFFTTFSAKRKIIDAQDDANFLLASGNRCTGALWLAALGLKEHVRSGRKRKSKSNPYNPPTVVSLDHLDKAKLGYMGFASARLYREVAIALLDNNQYDAPSEPWVAVTQVAQELATVAISNAATEFEFDTMSKRQSARIRRRLSAIMKRADGLNRSVHARTAEDGEPVARQPNTEDGETAAPQESPGALSKKSELSEAFTSEAEASEIMDFLVGERRRKGMTQESVAEKMGVRQGVVSSIEAHRNPKFDNLVKYARAVKVNLKAISTSPSVE